MMFIVFMQFINQHMNTGKLP